MQSQNIRTEEKSAVLRYSIEVTRSFLLWAPGCSHDQEPIRANGLWVPGLGLLFGN